VVRCVAGVGRKEGRKEGSTLYVSDVWHTQLESDSSMSRGMEHAILYIDCTRIVADKYNNQFKRCNR
jgi:hypothetical protein